MGSIEKELNAVFEDARRATDVPDSLADAVLTHASRQRATRVVGSSIGTLAAVGLAVSLPLALGHHGTSAVAPATTPSAMPVPTAPLGLACGDPVPASLLDSPDRITLYIWVDGTSIAVLPSKDVAETRGHPGEERTYVTLEGTDPSVVVATDGVVVGWTGDPPAGWYYLGVSSISVSVSSDSPTSGPHLLTPRAVVVCPEANNGANALVPGVTYDVYPVDGTRAP